MLPKKRKKKEEEEEKTKEKEKEATNAAVTLHTSKQHSMHLETQKFTRYKGEKTSADA